MDTSNAFNSINRATMLENVRRLCPAIYIYAYNCYSIHARLFVVGGKQLYSQEGTTQGDPTAMALYGIGTVPLLKHLQTDDTTQVGFADDLESIGKVKGVRDWFGTAHSDGPMYGWNDEPSKSWGIVKEAHLAEAQEAFAGTEVNITDQGKKQLGAAIGTMAHKEEYMEEKIKKWVEQVEVLAEVAKVDPHSAYCGFTAVMRHRYTFCMRTVKDISETFAPLELAIRSKLIPALTEGRMVTDDERLLLALPPRLGGMGLIDPTKICDLEYQLSRIATAELTEAIKSKKVTLPDDFDSKSKKDKARVKKMRVDFYQKVSADLLERVSPDLAKTIHLAKEKGASNWLTSLPLSEMDFHLSKREFWDAVSIRYNWPLSKIPTQCVCGSQFDLEHALSCGKGGFIIQRHNELRDLSANLLAEVCKDVAIEPVLEKLSGETFKCKSTITSDDARLDVSARGFWTRGQRAFLM